MQGTGIGEAGVSTEVFAAQEILWKRQTTEGLDVKQHLMRDESLRGRRQCLGHLCVRLAQVIQERQGDSSCTFSKQVTIS